MVAFLHPDSVRHPGVLITSCHFGLKLDEGVSDSWNQKHLYWEDWNAGYSGPRPGSDLCTAFVDEGFFPNRLCLKNVFFSNYKIINELLDINFAKHFAVHFMHMISLALQNNTEVETSISISQRRQQMLRN